MCNGFNVALFSRSEIFIVICLWNLDHWLVRYLHHCSHKFHLFIRIVKFKPDWLIKKELIRNLKKRHCSFSDNFWRNDVCLYVNFLKDTDKIYTYYPYNLNSVYSILLYYLLHYYCICFRVLLCCGVLCLCYCNTRTTVLLSRNYRVTIITSSS